MIAIESGVERFVRHSASAKAIQLELAYNPFPKQQAFHRSSAKYRLFGGAAGPGKSKALLMEAILQAHEHPNADTLLLRRTFPELEQSLLLYFRRDVPRELYANFQESKHLVTWRNGSTTRFGYCQSEHDVYQYQGAEFLFIGIDELTLFTLRQWQFLTSRNRCPTPGAFPCMAAATNPGNIGHAWVKSLWIDKQAAPGMEKPAEYDPSDYDFIPARVTDNPIYAGDEHYLKTLRALPSHLRRAFLDGDWDVFAGQYFDRFDYARHVLRAEQIGGPQVPGEGSLGDQWKPWWPRWISIDWGFEHPAATYWHASVPAPLAAAMPTTPDSRSAGIPPANLVFPVGARHAVPGTDSWRNAGHPFTSAAGTGVSPGSSSSRDREQNVAAGTAHVECGGLPPLSAVPASRDVLRTFVDASDWARQASPKNSGSELPHSTRAAPQSRVVTYREYVTRRTSPRELAREIIARSLLSSSGVCEREKIDAIYLSPDAFARRTDEASIAEQMGDIFAAAGLPRPVPADDDRVGGWMLMYQMLDAGEWLLTDNCIELLRTLPNLVRDRARVEDVEKMDGDDSADAARYGLKSRYAAHPGDPNGWRSRMPLADRLAARVVSADPTIRAMQARKAILEETRGSGPVPFAHNRRRYRDNP